MKTGLGSHLISLQAFTPRSLTGQIIYCHRMNNVPQTMAKSMVLKKAPTKPSTVFFGESLMRGVRPMVIPQTIGKDVITDDQRGGNPEPDETLENVVDDEMA
jgi:hypothetical protein